MVLCLHGSLMPTLSRTAAEWVSRPLVPRGQSHHPSRAPKRPPNTSFSHKSDPGPIGSPLGWAEEQKGRLLGSLLQVQAGQFVIIPHTGMRHGGGGVMDTHMWHHCPFMQLPSSDGVRKKAILSSFLGPCPQKGSFSKHNQTNELHDWFKCYIIFQGFVMFDSSFLTLVISNDFSFHFSLINAISSSVPICILIAFRSFYSFVHFLRHSLSLALCISEFFGTLSVS